MSKVFNLLTASMLIAGLLSFGTASAHNDPANGHFYCDDTSQNGNCGVNKTTGFTTSTNANAAGGSYSLSNVTDNTLSDYHTANWYIRTNDRVGTGNWYGFDVYIPNTTLHSSGLALDG